jgi:hypothetical protein
MIPRNDQIDAILTDLADGLPIDSQWDAWLLDHPEAAAEIEIVRKVRLLLIQLRDLPVEVPADFEARLLSRIQVDTTMLTLIDLSLAGWGSAILELIAMLLNILPAFVPAPSYSAAQV